MFFSHCRLLGGGNDMKVEIIRKEYPEKRQVRAKSWCVYEDDQNMVYACMKCHSESCYLI